MTMPFHAWTPLPQEVTRPDQIDQGAFELLPPMEDERIRACWRTSTGFLVLTDRRCLALHSEARVLGERGWRLGSTFYFSNLSPPEVVGGRFVQLKEQSYGPRGGERFAVADAAEVCRQIAEAIEPGRQEWELYRSMEPSAGGAPAHARAATFGPPGDPCSCCGNPVTPTDRECPSCRAPRP
ncbi:MAG: hypothetical protein L3K03_04830 [Thermoplasmata archaeon]|nr:hypothetical protein [Thermoplasmata archaeon]